MTDEDKPWPTPSPGKFSDIAAILKRCCIPRLDVHIERKLVELLIRTDCEAREEERRLSMAELQRISDVRWREHGLAKDAALRFALGHQAQSFDVARDAIQRIGTHTEKFMSERDKPRSEATTNAVNFDRFLQRMAANRGGSC